MFRLKALACSGCEASGNRDVFYGVETKRPLFLQCGHPMCSTCVKKFEKCLICKKDVVNIENYAARAIYEELRKDPISVFKSWFKANVRDFQIKKIKFLFRKLKLCITCELSLNNLEIDHVQTDGTEWPDFGQRELRRKIHEVNLERSKKYPNAKVEFDDYHDRYPSELNKFFESLPRRNLEMVPIEQGDTWIADLEIQSKYLDKQANCDCNKVLNEMNQLCFGNQIGKHFIQIINQLGDSIISECPFRLEAIQETLKKALEASNLKLYAIYKAFCWNFGKKRVCCLFDNFERKPCICYHCKTSTCLDCVTSNRSYKCSFCGELFFDQGLGSGNECVIDSEVMNLVHFYVRNCVDLYEKWWICEASELGFCVSCSSYSNQLEICVHCELTTNMNALKTKPGIESHVQFRQKMPLYFKYNKMEMFPIRWQCVDCKKRLEADWEHKYCDDLKSNEWKGTWNRGCNHVITRLYNTKTCSSYDVHGDKCEYNAIALSDIGYYEFAMKVATMGLVHKILKRGIEEMIVCKARKIRLLQIYGRLKTQTRYYFKRAMEGVNIEKLKHVSDDISGLINNLKLGWRDSEHEGTECLCFNIQNEVNDLDEESILPWVICL
ncbi:hypothetical protein GCK72_013908 [Caenorhabditis remanei]|uniref:RING-type domain-containing protein n=1 Tax=Caenorhabditis remanei TaxID=31234 RepID=A0A6A5GSW3_CAERE|nr:hypothetical protein GCK72_013908 [Caenorhabditis remanei]KAF1757452.1 hypothetical protein GCK72_013908 [Caenorhabditis remanei]